MKIAVCISGHVRNYKKFAKFFKNKLKTKQSTVDYFISIWDSVDWQNKPFNLFGYNLFNLRHQKLNIDSVSQIYNPVSMNINRSIDFSYLNLKRLAKSDKYFPKNHINQRSYEGVYSQYYLVNSCNELKKNYESLMESSYDLVIRTRPDFTLNQIIDLDEILPYSRDTIFLLFQKSIKNNHKKEKLQFTDVFAVSSTANMNKFSKFYKYYETYLNNYSNQRAEYLLEKYIRNELKLNIHGLDLSYNVASFTF